MEGEPEDAGGFSLSDGDYHVVVDAVRRWRQFARQMVAVYEERAGRSDPAYQGALHMVVLADQVLRILGRDAPESTGG